MYKSPTQSIRAQRTMHGTLLVERTLASLQGRHQREGVMWMCQREAHPGVVPSVAGGILADEMGMGKTYEVAALMRLRPMRTLVVTTLATLMQWQDVLSTHLGELPFVLRSKDHAGGGGFQRVKTVLTTYSMFQRCDRVPSALGMQGWGRIVLDEAHVIRNPKTNMHRSLSRLAAVHRWVLTGTPVNNTLRDLHSLVQWLGAPGLEVGLVREHLMLMRTKELSCGCDIPSLTIIDSIVVMSPTERHVYSMIVTSGRAHANMEVGDMDMLTHAPIHVHVMEAVLRCRQACTHLSIMAEAVVQAMRTEERSCTKMQLVMRHPDIATTPVSLMSAKLTRLVELVTAHSRTEKSLVFCDWLKEMELVERALTEGVGVRVLRYHGAMDVTGRQAVLRSFQGMEEGTVLLVQIQCGGTGLNIQSASRVYMMRPAWNPCIERQAIARVHRLGQTRAVIVTRLVAADSIDERCEDVQRSKLEVINSVMQPVLDITTAVSLLS